MKTQPTYIAPERLYTLRGFREASGISPTRMRDARLRGIEVPMLTVGKRKFVRGHDAIAYIERLAAEPPRSKLR
jgi:hypothetical protein